MTTPAPPTATLAAWLEQQVAADEALATAAWPDRWEADGNAVQSAATGLRAGYEGLHTGVAHLAMTVGNYQAEERNAAHIAANDPAQTLRRVAAIRQVLVLHEPIGGDLCLCCETEWPCETLRALASQYADRDGYRAEEWRP